MDVEATSLQKLELPLLTRNPETRHIQVNFDPALVRLLREVKYFLCLGLKVPGFRIPKDQIPQSAVSARGSYYIHMHLRRSLRRAIIAALISSAHGSVARTCSPQPACSSGVRDTAYCENINSSSVCAATSSCASYNEGYPSQKSNVALLAFAMTMAVGMCFCIGGNDSANSWGTRSASRSVATRSLLGCYSIVAWLLLGCCYLIVT